jgi:hypothetical protein
MANGSLQLREYPTDLVRLACEKCGRSGQYRKQNLIERYGADARLPDIREQIAKCSRHGQWHSHCSVGRKSTAAASAQHADYVSSYSKSGSAHTWLFVTV